MLRFIDGFDHYSLSDVTKKWTSMAGGDNAIVAAAGRNGSGAYRNAFNGNNLSKILQASPTWVLGFGFKNSMVGGAVIVSGPTAGSGRMGATFDHGGAS